MADTKILDVYIPCQTCGKLIPAGGDNRCLTCRLIDLALEPKLKWIPVTERLPEESGEYLAYCGWYDGICVLHYEILKTKGKWRSKWKEVTHWMPLPEPPKGE